MSYCAQHHYDHYCLKLVQLYKYKMAWKHSQACQEWPLLAAQPLLRILSVLNLHKIICKCVGPVSRSDQRQAGTHRPLVPHSAVWALPFVQNSARPAVSCSCRVGERSGINSHSFVSTRAKSAHGTPSDLWSKAAVRHPECADVRPRYAGHTDGECRRDSGEGREHQSWVSRSTVRKAVLKDSYFAYSGTRDLMLFLPWSPVPASLGSPPQHRAAPAGPARLRRAQPLPGKDSKACPGSLGGSEPLSAAPGPGAEPSTFHCRRRTERAAPRRARGRGPGRWDRAGATGRGGPRREDGRRPLTCPPVVAAVAILAPRCGRPQAGIARPGLSWAGRDAAELGFGASIPRASVESRS